MFNQTFDPNYTSELAPVTVGRCSACQEKYNRAEMASHLEECPKRKAEIATGQAFAAQEQSGLPVKWYAGQLFSLLVQARQAPQTYWMYVEVPGSTSLLKLDSFLRRVWLECCGHLSQFELGGKRYARYPDREYEDIREYAMSGVKLDKMVEVGTKFSYEYDYGSTTSLVLRVVSAGEGPILGKRPEPLIMGRNERPPIVCEECCQVPATLVSAEGSFVSENEDYYGRRWLCEKDAHRRKYQALEDYYLPVLNSPRTGRCGYDGMYTPGIKGWSK